MKLEQMETPYWRKVDELLQAVLTLAPAQRAGYLQTACANDAALRGEVEALLAEAENADDFLAAAAIQFGKAIELSAAAVADQQLGPYRLVRELGRGGMGTVWLAERADAQYTKQVAIKLVKRGMDTVEILRRFRAERQILASLEHPNIAHLHDGGVTTDGLPYLVMEYIEGWPIDEYCQRERLGLTQRLELFQQVCAAVQYAHHNLVVHRDLKPSNIFVTAAGVPKLLDFGIAKLLNPQADISLDSSLLHGWHPMTPEYASPEQVHGARITTASDVYALGIVLYQLLTGQRPYQLANHAPAEMVQIICEHEPEKPSTQVAHAPADFTQENLAKWSRALAGDLDNIVRKALQKEPEQRYRSVEAFAADLQRHLTGLPVTARPATFGYRVEKYVRRHKVGVGLTLVVLLTLLVALGITIGQRRTAQIERAKAERRFNDVRKLANSFMFDFHNAIKDLAGATPARQLLVKKALEYLDSLTQESSNDPSLLNELATAFQQLGDVQGELFAANVGDSTGALQSYRKALSLREQAAATAPTNLQIRQDLANDYLKIGRNLVENGDATGGLESGRKGITLHETLFALAPIAPQTRLDLATAYRTLFYIQAYSSDLSDSLQSLRKAIELGEAVLVQEPKNLTARRLVAGSQQVLGDQLWLQGNPVQAWESYRRAQQITSAWADEDPGNVTPKRGVALSQVFIGDMHLRTGNPTEALGSYQKALVFFQDNAKRDDGNKTAARNLQFSNFKIAEAYTALGQRQQAIKTYRSQSIPLLEALLTADPQNLRHARDLGENYINISQLLLHTGNRAAARVYGKKAADIFERLLERDPHHREFCNYGGWAFILWGEILSQDRRAEEARRYLMRGLALKKEQADRPGMYGDRINHYALTLLTCEPAEMRNPVEALQYAKLAAERTRENDPYILRTLALAYYQTGDQPAALKTTLQALSLLPPIKVTDSVLRQELKSLLAKVEKPSKGHWITR